MSLPSDLAEKASRSHALLTECVERYQPVAVVGLFSGGHDSLTATHIASQHPAFSLAAHINTGIGVKQTREFVRWTCEQEGWLLAEYHAEHDAGQSYRDLVLEYGFPGPPHHYKMYNRLKERCLRVLKREAKRGHPRRAKVLLVSGCRSQESDRRMGNVEPHEWEGGFAWAAIIHDWSKDDCNRYIDALGLRRNPVVDLIHKSGECLCGAYAQPPASPYTGERGPEFKELALWFPETAAEIEALEAEVRAAGFPWNWDERRPKWFDDQARGQEFMFDMEGERPAMPLCRSCEKQDAPEAADA